jgi:hypothetical protein
MKNFLLISFLRIVVVIDRSASPCQDQENETLGPKNHPVSLRAAKFISKYFDNFSPGRSTEEGA